MALLTQDLAWDREADVVVIGFGAAGAAAALSAAEAGAETLLLEKQRFGHGPEEGNHYSTSHMSGGVFLQPTDRQATINYFVASAHMEGTGAFAAPGGWTDNALIEAYTDEALLNHDWVVGLGGEIAKTGEGAEHAFPGQETFESYRFKDSGLGMMRFFERIVAERGIEVSYSTSADRLMTNLQGEVIGVRVLDTEDPTRVQHIRARRGVIMTLGGFEFDEQMKMNFLRSYPSYFTGSEACTGDGIKMAQDVGAQLWHMNCVSARFVAKFPEFPNGITMWMGMRKPETPIGYVLVDKYGKRFTNERIKAHTAYYEAGLFDSHKIDFPRIPAYWIFDQRRLEAAKLPIQTSGITGPMKRYVWSRGNVRELERGWILKGDTPEELGEQLGLAENNLAGTIRRYNELCAEGSDLDHGRPESDLIPLDEPPFYGVRVWPGGPNTQGGAKRDAAGQILNVDDIPIPGLYGAGEFGSMFGMLYPGGGGNISECFAFGRISGRNAARCEVRRRD